MKNALALIGLAVLTKKGYEFFCHYRNLRQENAFFQKNNRPAQTGSGSNAQSTPEST